MTYEEAKNVILNTYIRFGRSNGKAMFCKAVSKSLSAIEKQIPKKPLILPIAFKSTENVIIRSVMCSDCKGTFMLDTQIKHCPFCGQAIDWSEEICSTQNN